MAKYLPHGTTFSIGGTAVGGLITVSIPDQTKGEAEETDSDSGGDREWRPALRDGGTVNLIFRHDPADTGQIALEDNYDGDSKEECIITLPSGAGGSGYTYTFQGFVTKYPQGDLALAGDEVAQQTSAVRVSGSVTKAAVA